MTPEALTVAEALEQTITEMRNAGCDTPELDARLLLMGATGYSHAELISKSRDALEDDKAERFAGFSKRRLSKEPVHRILGRREFYGREFFLSPETLVPRPDTEVLIDVILDECRKDEADVRILDLGTGSGIIAITLVAELPKTEVVAVDISAQALVTAQKNADSLKVKGRVSFLHGDLYEPVTGQFDLIVSNPPYIKSTELEGLQDEVRLHDPIDALDGGSDGLVFYRRIFGESCKYLRGNAAICVEIGHDQGQKVCSIARECGYASPEVCRDFGGRDRVVIARRSGQIECCKNAKVKEN